MNFRVIVVALVANIVASAGVCQSQPWGTVEISTTVEDHLGLPVVAPVEIFAQCYESPSSYFHREVVTPDSNGHASILASFQLSSIVNGTLKVSVFGAPGVVRGDGTRDFFFNAQDGRAAFHPPGIIDHNAQTGVYSFDPGVSTLSEPSLVGTVSLTYASTQGVDLVFLPATSEVTFNSLELSEYGYRRAIVGAPGSVPLYSWTRRGGSSVQIEGPGGTPLARTLVRRGQQVSLSIPRENTIDVSVSQATHPDARYVVLVESSHHQPDPSKPSGSLVEFDVQRGRAWFGRRYDEGAGVLAATVLTGSKDYVVEVWGVTGSSEAMEDYRLIVYAPLNPATGDETVVLN